MNLAQKTPGRLLVGLACTSVLGLATALPAEAAHGGQARSPHGLVKKMPKRWLRAHDLAGRAGAPLADPDHDGIPNWVEFRQGTNPMLPNAVSTTPATTPPAAPTSATRIVRLEGTVAAVTPTSITLTTDNGLSASVSLPAGVPVVDEQGLPVTLVPGDQVKAFVSQAADLSLTAVIVFAEGQGNGGEPGDDGPSATTPGAPGQPGVTPPGGGGGRGDD